MTIGELRTAQGGNQDSLLKITEEVVSKARRLFGHVDSRTDAECLTLLILQQERFASERNDALNAVSNQATMIARLASELSVAYQERDAAIAGAGKK